MTNIILNFDDLQTVLQRQIEDTMKSKIAEFVANKGFAGLRYTIESEVRDIVQNLLQKGKFKDQITKAVERKLAKSIDKFAEAAVQAQLKR